MQSCWSCGPVTAPYQSEHHASHPPIMMRSRLSIRQRVLDHLMTCVSAHERGGEGYLKKNQGGITEARSSSVYMSCWFHQDVACCEFPGMLNYISKVGLPQYSTKIQLRVYTYIMPVYYPALCLAPRKSFPQKSSRNIPAPALIIFSY